MGQNQRPAARKHDVFTKTTSTSNENDNNSTTTTTTTNNKNNSSNGKNKNNYNTTTTTTTTTAAAATTTTTTTAKKAPSVSQKTEKQQVPKSRSHHYPAAPSSPRLGFPHPKYSPAPAQDPDPHRRRAPLSLFRGYAPVLSPCTCRWPPSYIHRTRKKQKRRKKLDCKTSAERYVVTSGRLRKPLHLVLARGRQAIFTQRGKEKQKRVNKQKTKTISREGHR